MSSRIYKRKLIIERGEKFNLLTAIKFKYKNKRSTQYWLFRCDCGKEKIIRIDGVKAGKVKSCGCLLKKGGRLKHGMYGTRTYTTWQRMKDRCLNKNNPDYRYYGGRGITICDRWLKFENFYKDMGERPKNKTLDRIRNSEGYSKENCRWATPKEQQNNTRANHFLTFNNKTQNIQQWSEELGINNMTIYSRIRNGWNVKKALTK